MVATAATDRQRREILVRRALRATAMFSGWADPHLDRLVTMSRLVDYPRGSEVPTGVRKLREIVVVVSGCLELSSIGPQGRRHVMTLLGPGEVSGLVRMIDAPVLPTHYRVLDDTKIIHVACRELNMLLDEAPLLWRDFARQAIARHYAGVRARHHQAVSTTLGQLAAKLIELQTRQGQSPGPGGKPRPLHVSQLEIAALLGVSRQTARKAIHDLAARRVVALEYGHIAILDMEALRALES
jgi:CRP/FNR family cyclic AMP-dependent transcriptional regulator